MDNHNLNPQTDPKQVSQSHPPMFNSVTVEKLRNNKVIEYNSGASLKKLRNVLNSLQSICVDTFIYDVNKEILVDVINERHSMVIRMIQENIEAIRIMCCLDRGHRRKLITRAEQNRRSKSLLKYVSIQPRKASKVANGENILADKNVGEIDTYYPIIPDKSNISDKSNIPDERNISDRFDKGMNELNQIIGTTNSHKLNNYYPEPDNVISGNEKESVTLNRNVFPGELNIKDIMLEGRNPFSQVIVSTTNKYMGTERIVPYFNMMPASQQSSLYLNLNQSS